MTPKPLCRIINEVKQSPQVKDKVLKLANISAHESTMKLVLFKLYIAACLMFAKEHPASLQIDEAKRLIIEEDDSAVCHTKDRRHTA